jgi:hypothetical protein
MKLLAAVLLTLALAPAAHAECARPTWIGTPTGSVLPEHGSLYIYDSGYSYNAYSDLKETVFSDGVPHRWAETRVSDDILRVDYAAGLATTMQVGVGWAPVTYTIDPMWKAPADAPRVLQYWHQVSEWTCSRTDSVMIQIDQPTAAFRVRWTNLDDIGSTREYIEPAQTGDNGRSVLELGKHNCIGEMHIRPEELAAGGVLELVAIRFDGSEVAVTGLPEMIDTSEMRTSDGGIEEAIGYATPLPPAPPAPPVVTNARSGDAFLAIAAGGVGLLFVGMMLAGRKRAPTPVQM